MAGQSLYVDKSQLRRERSSAPVIHSAHGFQSLQFKPLDKAFYRPFRQWGRHTWSSEPWGRECVKCSHFPRLQGNQIRAPSNFAIDQADAAAFHFSFKPPGESLPIKHLFVIRKELLMNILDRIPQRRRVFGLAQQQGRFHGIWQSKTIVQRFQPVISRRSHRSQAGLTLSPLDHGHAAPIR